MAPPPPIEKIKYNNCLDIMETFRYCIKTTHETQSNITSIQKNYLHPIYYPVNELKECVAFRRFETNQPIKINITDKMNTEIYYMTTYDRNKNELHLQL
jgi:hypothetical protein